MEVRSKIFTPISRRTVLDWAKEERYLSPDSSSISGMWNPVFAGSIEPLLSVTKAGVRNITLMTSAQLMKSDFILNVLGYYLSEDPTSCILAQPTDSQAEEFSKSRIDTLIRDTSILNQNIKDKRERDSGNNIFFKQFQNGAKLSIVSAASPSDLASRSARVVLLDELDRYKSLSTEGDPEQLLQARTTTFFNSLFIAVSTPTNDGSSRIANRFEKSSQGYYHMKCPHCGEYEKPQWSQVYYDSDSCGYICSHCSVLWSESERYEAIKQGKYIHKYPERTEHLGFHANSICNPFQPLNYFVKIYEDAKKSPESLRSFTNVHLAETYKPAVDVPDWQKTYERRETYKNVPNDVQFLTMGVDVQGDRLECLVLGFAKNKQIYAIEYRQLLGPTHDVGVWNELQNFMNKDFKKEDGSSLKISMTTIDSGFNTSHVHSFVSKQNPTRCRAIKGSDSLNNYFKMGSSITTQNPIYGHKTWIVGSSFIKTELFGYLKLPVEDENGNSPQGFVHFPEWEPSFFKGLCSESLTLHKGKYSWIKHYQRNEPLDLWVYARSAASMIGFDSMTDQNWESLKQNNENSKPAVAPRSIQKTQNNNNNLWKHQNLKKF